jgi:hypothetical protein
MGDIERPGVSKMTGGDDELERVEEYFGKLLEDFNSRT